MKDFKGLDLHPALEKSLDYMEYTKPTPIQAQAIPLALKGRDILGSAQTGTGKTAAFGIPLIQQLMSSEQGSALILTPTRELGKQIMEIMQKMLGPRSNIDTAFIIGGESMGKQLQQLKRNPRLIVGTPGRINDHLERGTMKLHDTNFLVLDETDRMLDMGFSVQLDRIAKYLTAKRQTLMFSATMPKNIIKMADKYLNNPERISVGSTSNPIKNIKQQNIKVTQEGKYNELLRQLDERTGTIIIFAKTKYGAERLAKKLKKADHSADAIHGDLKQNRRDRVIESFRQKQFRILVATDVVARGLDIPHIEHVINHDLPQVPEDYIHRIGRTARAGSTGEAVNLISEEDGRKWHAIQQFMNPEYKPHNSSRFADKDKKKKKPSRGGSKSNTPASKKRYYSGKKKTKMAA